MARAQEGQSCTLPDILREFFVDVVEGDELDRYCSVPPEAHDDPLRSITGERWQCSDVMPRDLTPVIRHRRRTCSMR